MYYFFFNQISDFIYDLIGKMGVDLFINLSIIMWIFVIINFFRRGTRL